MTDEEKKIIRAAAYVLGAMGEDALSNHLIAILRPPAPRRHKSTGQTARSALQGAIDQGATRVRRIARPAGAGRWVVEFDIHPRQPRPTAAIEAHPASARRLERMVRAHITGGVKNHEFRTGD